MKLFDHQQQALDWADGRHHFPCFMEMRTGKSLVAIHQALQWSDDVLLIAPISTWYDWEHLLRQLHIEAVFLSGPTKQKRKILDAAIDYGVQWYVVNPEGVTRWGKELFAKLYAIANICILDESVFIKNPRAKITKMLLKYRHQFCHRMIMTGTPIAETTEDVVCQMIFCLGEFMGFDNFYKWRMHYMKPGGFGWRLKQGSARLIREALHEESFILSAKDAGMFTEQVKQTHLVEMPKQVERDYKELEKAWALGEASTKYGVVKDAWLAMLASGIYPADIHLDFNPFKIKSVKELVEGKQVVLFSKWVSEVYEMSRLLKCPCITGNTIIEERKKLIEAFRRNEFQHLVCQVTTAAKGLDLSCIDTAIMLSNPWEHNLRQQITARMNHPTRKVPTLFIDVLTKGTIEEQVYELLEQKRLNARQFLHKLKIKVSKKNDYM